jgi:hypothetical protein
MELLVQLATTLSVDLVDKIPEVVEVVTDGHTATPVADQVALALLLLDIQFN